MPIKPLVCVCGTLCVTGWVNGGWALRKGDAIWAMGNWAIRVTHPQTATHTHIGHTHAIRGVCHTRNRGHTHDWHSTLPHTHTHNMHTHTHRHHTYTHAHTIQFDAIGLQTYDAHTTQLSTAHTMQLDCTDETHYTRHIRCNCDKHSILQLMQGVIAIRCTLSDCRQTWMQIRQTDRLDRAYRQTIRQTYDAVGLCAHTQTIRLFSYNAHWTAYDLHTYYDRRTPYTTLNLHMLYIRYTLGQLLPYTTVHMDRRRGRILQFSCKD